MHLANLRGICYYNDDILFGENWNKKAGIRKKGTIPSALFLER